MKTTNKIVFGDEGLLKPKSEVKYTLDQKSRGTVLLICYITLYPVLLLAGQYLPV